MSQFTQSPSEFGGSGLRGDTSPGSWQRQEKDSQLTAELTFTGRVIKAEEALQLGLLLEIVDPSELLPRATLLAAEFAAKPPQALRLTKRLMKAAQRFELGDLLEMSASYQASCHHTEDLQRAMDAILDRTEAAFKGN